MGASISYDTSYILTMNADVECFTLYPAKSKSKSGGSKSQKGDKSSGKRRKDDSGSGSGSESGSGSDSESGSDSGSESGSDEGELQRVEVKITPDIVGYIKNYIRGKDFMAILDDVTEIDLEEYGHAPDTALVFDTTNVKYDNDNNTIEAYGSWDYIPPKNTGNNNHNKKIKFVDDNDNDNNDEYERGGGNGNGRGPNTPRKRQSRTITQETPKYKTKDDDLPVSDIMSVIRDRFVDSCKNNDFVIHETKSNMLMLNISSVDLIKE